MCDAHSTESYHFDAKIMIVDDDVMFATILRHMLIEYSDQYFAESAIEGLKLARRIIPDIILLDYDLPDASGVDLCAMLKSDPKLSDIPVIFITSHRGVAVLAATFRAGGADFVTKPVDLDDLETTIRKTLADIAKTRELERLRAAAEGRDVAGRSPNEARQKRTRVYALHLGPSDF